MDSIINKISSVANLIGGVILGLMVFFVTLQVVMRMCGASLLFVDELSGYSSIWATFLGISLAMRQGTHVRVDLVTRKIPPKTEAFLTVVGDVFCVLFALVMIVKGFTLIETSFISERKTSMLQWPVWVLQSVFPVGFLVFGLESLAHAVSSWKRMKQLSGAAGA